MEFNFTSVFNQNSDQELIFEKVARPVVLK